MAAPSRWKKWEKHKLRLVTKRYVKPQHKRYVKPRQQKIIKLPKPARKETDTDGLCSCGRIRKTRKYTRWHRDGFRVTYWCLPPGVNCWWCYWRISIKEYRSRS